MKHLKYL